MKKVLGILLLAMSISVATYAQYENSTIKVGQKAPDLSFPSPKGDTLTLSKLYAKRIILLDFWASWCGPCRRSNPRLVQLYDAYKGKKFKMAKKGFDIVSVSLDQEKEKWVAAIEKDGLSWTGHMSDLGGWGAKPAADYGVAYVPQAFLIGPDGTVWKKYNSAEEAEADLDNLSKGLAVYTPPADKKERKEKN